jgi:hypothetical protein
MFYFKYIEEKEEEEKKMGGGKEEKRNELRLQAEEADRNYREKATRSMQVAVVRKKKVKQVQAEGRERRQSSSASWVSLKGGMIIVMTRRVCLEL